jgi:DNA-binding NtrC family response regulator
MYVEAHSRGTTILLVEQEAQLRAKVSAVLGASGFAVVEVASQREAYATLEERADVRVMVSDLDTVAPDRGLAFAHEVHDRWPAIGLVITSGRVRHMPPTDVPGDGIFMPRPLPIETFLEVVGWVAQPVQDVVDGAER